MFKKTQTQPVSATDLSTLVQRYIENSMSVLPSPWTKLLPRTSPDLVWINAANQKAPNYEIGITLEDMFEKDPATFSEALTIASKASNTKRAGIALGFLAPEIEVDYTPKQKERLSTEFKEGVKEGQIYALKGGGVSNKLGLAYAGYLITMGALYYLSKNQSFIPLDTQEYEKLIRIEDTLMNVGKASFLYGFGSLLISGLFNKDGQKSDTLITSGPYRYHRNPFYASGALGLALVTSPFFMNQAVSSDPSYLGTAAALAGIALIFTGYHRYTKQDEKVLEKTFGQEYRDYKDSTPRYFPALWKLFQRKEKTLTPTE